VTGGFLILLKILLFIAKRQMVGLLLKKPKELIGDLFRIRDVAFLDLYASMRTRSIRLHEEFARTVLDELSAS
jgi:hypothetical protein